MKSEEHDFIILNTSLIWYRKEYQCLKCYLIKIVPDKEYGKQYYIANSTIMYNELTCNEHTLLGIMK